MNSDKQNQYLNIAYQRAKFNPQDWKPELGFTANETILLKLYEYYQAIYQQQPNKFLWAGLARLTGGQVLWGMKNLCRVAKDPCVITQQMMHIAQEVFDELAWQHEYFLDNAEEFIQYLKVNHFDERLQEIWMQLLETNDENTIAEINMKLLHYEQFATIQKRYEIMRGDTYCKPFVFLMRFAMRNIHKHHSRFIVDIPFGDVTVFQYRWQWIAQPKGMWDTWTTIGKQERDRLVALSNQQVIAHDW
jgi:hypothetical protein